MRPAAKVALISGGYVLAVLLAFAVVALNIAATSNADREASSGMFAFADGMLFLAVLGVAAVPSSVGALFLLRPYRVFWLVLCVAAISIATTGALAAVVYVAAKTAEAGSMIETWSALAVLRILLAPLFALAFLVCGLIAPLRPMRIALLIAMATEAAVFTGWLLTMVQEFRSY